MPVLPDSIGYQSIDSAAQSSYAQPPNKAPNDNFVLNVIDQTNPAQFADRIDVSHDSDAGWNVNLVTAMTGGLIGPRGSVADTIRAVISQSAFGERVRINIHRPLPPAVEPRPAFEMPLVLEPTPRLVEALTLAARAAADQPVDTAHLLLGIVDEPANVAHRVLAAASVDESALRRLIITRASDSEPSDRHPLTAPARAVFEGLPLAAASLGHQYFGVEHLLLAIAAERAAAGRAILASLDADEHKVRRAVEQVMSGRSNGACIREGRASPTNSARLLGSVDHA